jgi:branched-chain amino acid transport system permease protein
MNRKRLFSLVTLLTVSIATYVILAVLMFTGIIDEYNGQLLSVAGIYVIISLSLNLITGFTGQLALGQAGFMCVGAYSTAIALMKFNLPIFPALIVGGLVTATFGFLIGFPVLRLRGDYLAVATLGFGEIIRVIMINLDSLTGGPSGLQGIPTFSDSDNFILADVIRFTWVFGFVIITILIVSHLIRSSPGRAIVSIREDEIASNSMGINVPYYKMLSFTIAAFIAGCGGGLYALYFGYLDPSMFGFMNSANFVLIIVLGGLGSITGTIISAVGFTFIQEWLRVFDDFRLIIFGLALIIIMLFWPRGLMSMKEFSVVSFVKKIIAGDFAPKKVKANLSARFISWKKNREVK